MTSPIGKMNISPTIEDQVFEWIESQHGSAGWEWKLVNLVEDLLASAVAIQHTKSFSEGYRHGRTGKSEAEKKWWEEREKKVVTSAVKESHKNDSTPEDIRELMESCKEEGVKERDEEIIKYIDSRWSHSCSPANDIKKWIEKNQSDLLKEEENHDK